MKTISRGAPITSDLVQNKNSSSLEIYDFDCIFVLGGGNKKQLLKPTKHVFDVRVWLDTCPSARSHMIYTANYYLQDGHNSTAAPGARFFPAHEDWWDSIISGPQVPEDWGDPVVSGPQVP